MTNNIAPLPSGEIDNNSAERAILVDTPVVPEMAPEDARRAGAYQLLARLLRMAPERRLLNQLSAHHVPEQSGEDLISLASKVIADLNDFVPFFYLKWYPRIGQSRSLDLQLLHMTAFDIDAEFLCP